MKKQSRKRYIVQGQVQGVGFRPFIWRLAHDLKLTGFVRNSSSGVNIEVQGDLQKIELFEQRFNKELPPLAKVENLLRNFISLKTDEQDFQIIQSESKSGQNVLVSPDVSICGDCLNDIFNPANRRFGYAFTNCCNCGPRYTITHTIPYDRKTTAMSCFSLCKPCKNEYENPADRRFHAQPVACPDCGPKLWFVTKNAYQQNKSKPSAENTYHALEKAAKAILDGDIIALKGLGGFQLVCNARNENTVARLRSSKNRPHKALAVMAENISGIKDFCDLNDELTGLLESAEKPIVLCPINENGPAPLAGNIAPDTSTIGVMLPYTPLHALLMNWLAKNGPGNPVLVMTSANPKDEPICLENREALQRLSAFADGWLMHDRDILVRVDDSVAGVYPVYADLKKKDDNKKISNTSNFIIRRARGYTPRPINLCGFGSQPVLGTGAELKNTFCLTRNDQAFPSQHIGDLSSPAMFNFYTSALHHLKQLLEIEPVAVIHDLHPDFISTRFAQDLAEKERLMIGGLQHHAAHAAAVMIDNEITEPALVLCLDGSGLGDNNQIWGCELIKMNLLKPQWERVGSMQTFPLPGGDAAVKEPWRIGRALQVIANKYLRQNTIRAECAIDEMIERKLNCSECSSCGRLFDGISALLGLCPKISYEGQAAIIMEKYAHQWLKNNSPEKLALFSVPLITKNSLPVIDFSPMISEIIDCIQNGFDISYISASFHLSLCQGLAQLCKSQAEKYRLDYIGLTGGSLQNSILNCYLIKYLDELGLKPFNHKNLPSGDGAISIGQAVWGSSLLKAGYSKFYK